MKNINRLLLTLTCLLTYSTAYGHGVQHHILEGGVGVEVHSPVILPDDVEIPLAGAQVQVFRPGDNELVFQTGHTDPHGIFMFNPDTTGIWTMKFMDETGHGKEVELKINELNLVELEPVSNADGGISLVSGLGYVLFIFALWVLLKKKK